MKKYDLFGYQVEIDESATRKWYENAEEWGCDCGDCRHFVSLAKKRELPDELIETLAQYGAPGFPTPHFDLEFWVRCF